MLPQAQSIPTTGGQDGDKPKGLVMVEAQKWFVCGVDVDTVPDLGWTYKIWWRCPCGHGNRMKHWTPIERKMLSLRCKDCGGASEVIPILPEHQV